MLPFPVSAWGSSGPFGGAISTTDLISYWKMEQASGSNQLDSAGGGNSMVPHNTPTSVTGKIGNAGGFNGTNQYFQAANNTSLQTNGTSFSMTAWVKFISTTGTQDILAKNAGSPTSEYDFRWEGTAWKMYVWDPTANGFNIAVLTTTPSAATWYFLYGEWDNVAKKSGIALNAGALTQSAAGSSGPNAITEPVLMGAVVSGAPQAFWDGQIDEVSFWKRKLTAAELTTLYNGGNGLTY